MKHSIATVLPLALVMISFAATEPAKTVIVKGYVLDSACALRIQLWSSPFKSNGRDLPFRIEYLIQFFKHADRFLCVTVDALRRLTGSRWQHGGRCVSHSTNRTAASPTQWSTRATRR